MKPFSTTLKDVHGSRIGTEEGHGCAEVGGVLAEAQLGGSQVGKGDN